MSVDTEEKRKIGFNKILRENKEQKTLYFYKGIDLTLHTIDENKVLEKLVPIGKTLISNELSFCSLIGYQVVSQMINNLFNIF